MSIGREREDLAEVKSLPNKELLAAMEFSTPSREILKKIQPGNDVLPIEFIAFKTIVQRFKSDITPEILFTPLQPSVEKKELNVLTLFIIACHDPELFLHVVHYANRDSIHLMVHQCIINDNNTSLFLRPLFEKATHKDIDDAFESVLNRVGSFNKTFMAFLQYSSQEDVLSLIQKMKAETFKQIFLLHPELIDILIIANQPEYVDIILPHLPCISVIKRLTEGYRLSCNDVDREIKPLDYVLPDRSPISQRDSFFRHMSVAVVSPHFKRVPHRNEAAIRLIELLPQCPRLDAMFTNRSVSFVGKPQVAYSIKDTLVDLAQINPDLLQVLLYRASHKDILETIRELRKRFPHLVLDISRIESLGGRVDDEAKKPRLTF